MILYNTDHNDKVLIMKNIEFSNYYTLSTVGKDATSRSWKCEFESHSGLMKVTVLNECSLDKNSKI